MTEDTPPSPARIPWIRLAAGPLCMLFFGLLCRYGFGLDAAQSWTAAITALCAAWWLLEPIPIPATSIIPFALFPLTGVLNYKQVAGSYGHTLILLFMGGFMLSKAMEKSGAHRRLAISMVRAVGGNGGRWVVLGFMLASCMLSMWISNTATTLMLLPIAAAVLDQSQDKKLAIPLLLGIAYAASIGGMGTPIGTPTNGVFISQYAEHTQIEVGFMQWMGWALPVVALMLPVAWLWICRHLKSSEKLVLPSVGRWNRDEIGVLSVFLLTACLWIFREAPGGGWEGLLVNGLGLKEKSIDDSTVALAMVLLMFLIPSRRGGGLLDWPTAVSIPWGILLLFGGGLAIAEAFRSSGLSDQLGAVLKGLGDWPVVLVVGVICLSVTFLTEVTSNTATASVLLPVLAAAATAMGADPRLLMVPATISASCAFMLPVATPPNAIVFSSDRLSIRDMAREGLMLNLIGVVIITAIAMLLLR